MIFFTLLSCFASRLHYSMLVSSHAVTVPWEPCCEHWSIVVEAALAVMSLAIWLYVITTYRFCACTCSMMYSFHYYVDCWLGILGGGGMAPLPPPPKSALASVHASDCVCIHRLWSYDLWRDRNLYIIIVHGGRDRGGHGPSNNLVGGGHTVFGPPNILHWNLKFNPRFNAKGREYVPRSAVLDVCTL